MQYPLREKIGNPDLFVGREKELNDFDYWVSEISNLNSQSRALLGRRKSGKTAFVQRLFNRLWSANGDIIPFYFSIPESKVWYPNFAVLYYQTFASQYISFLERDPMPMRQTLTMEEILAYGKEKSIASLVSNTHKIMDDEKAGRHSLMWDTAYRAPHRTADIEGQLILVILDEFQYISNKIYAREDLSGEPIETMPGSYHEVSESKIAPMIATGSYVGWMLEIMSQYLEAGRLTYIDFSPYLDDEEGLVSVYKYVSALKVPITNESAVQINKLCKADPFLISCMIRSQYPKRDLTTKDGVVATFEYEVGDRMSYISRTWAEYINMTVERINDRYGKHMLLHLSKHNDRYWTPQELKKELHLQEDESTIRRKLESLVKGDLLEWGPADIEFRGLQDGTLNRILRHRFEREIKDHKPDFTADYNEELANVTKENSELRGQLNRIKGLVTEVQFAYALRSRGRFWLSDFFEGVDKDSSENIKLNIVDVQISVDLRRKDGGKKEINIVASSNGDKVLLIEAKNKKRKPNHEDVEDFLEKVALYQNQHPDKTILTGYLSLHGFTKKGLDACKKHGIAWTTDLKYF